MNMNLLAIISGGDGNYYFDNMAESLVYALIGVAVVFAGILILIGLLYLVGYIIRKVEKSNVSLFKKKGAVVEDGAPAGSEEVPDEVKAAIVAAVMAYYRAEKPQCEFVVKRIKRIKE